MSGLSLDLSPEVFAPPAKFMINHQPRRHIAKVTLDFITSPMIGVAPRRVVNECLERYELCDYALPLSETLYRFSA